MKNYIETGMDSIAKAVELFKSGRASSLSSYARDTRIEPEVLVENPLLDLPEITDLLQVLCGTYAGWYLMGVNISINVGRIETSRLLNKLATHRDPVNSIADRVGAAISTESFAGLPMGLSLENYGSDLDAYHDVSTEGIREPRGLSGGASRDSAKMITERPSLAVGRVLQVQLCDNGQEATIPVTVRLNVNAIPSSPMVTILTADSKDLSTVERYHDWKSGRISFWKDAIGMSDLVKAHKEALLADESGTYQRIVQRKRRNQLAGALTLNPSANNMSAMFVMEKATAERIEREGSLRFKSETQRQRIFDAVAAIFLVVVDREWERVTIYTESVSEPTTYTYSQLKSEVRAQGPNVQDLMKEFQKSISPF